MNQPKSPPYNFLPHKNWQKGSFKIKYKGDEMCGVYSLYCIVVNEFVEFARFEVNNNAINRRIWFIILDPLNRKLVRFLNSFLEKICGVGHRFYYYYPLDEAYFAEKQKGRKHWTNEVLEVEIYWLGHGVPEYKILNINGRKYSEGMIPYRCAENLTKKHYNLL